MDKPRETMQSDCGWNKTFAEIKMECESAMVKFPKWPVDPLHAIAIIGEEFGELQKAVVDHRFFKDSTVEDMITEATQTAAMCVRFIMRLREAERERD